MLVPLKSQNITKTLALLRGGFSKVKSFDTLTIESFEIGMILWVYSCAHKTW